MTALPMRLAFNRLPWSVPSEEHAFDGWLEGAPTDAQRETALARTREARAAWKPDVQAWTQFVQLQRFIGHRITIQFWNPVMYALSEHEWPTRVEARCEGVITLIDDGFLQAFWMFARWLDKMNRTVNEKRSCWHVTIDEVDGKSMLVRKKGIPRIDLSPYRLPPPQNVKSSGKP